MSEKDYIPPDYRIHINRLPRQERKQYIYTYVVLPDEKLRNAIAMQFVPMLYHIIGKLNVKIPTALNQEDLFQEGMQAILQAIENFDAQKGSSLFSYVYIRSYGAMIDLIRKAYFGPADVQAERRRIEEAIEQVYNNNYGEVTDIDIAEQMGVPLTEYFRMLKRIHQSVLYRMEDRIHTETCDNRKIRDILTDNVDFTDLPAQYLSRSIFDYISRLSQTERMIILMIYFEGQSQANIARILGYSAAWVSLKHKAAMQKLTTYVKRKENRHTT